MVLSNRKAEGQPLPNPLKVFEDHKITYSRSQLSIVAAAPGAGKTSLAIWQILRMMYEDQGVPTLYMSADTDMMTIASSALAGVMDITTDEAKALITADDPKAMKTLEDWSSHIWFCFRRGPTLQDIGIEVEAYAHVHGEYPHLIVIDTLKAIAEKGEENHRYAIILPALSELAGDVQAHVMVLHHCIGSYQNGDTPIPLDGLKFKTSEEASMILSLFRPEPGMLGVRILKNRNGMAYPDGTYGTDIAWESSRGWFAE